MSSKNSDANLHTATFTWMIDDFPSLETKDGYLTSYCFSADGNGKIKWCLLLKPNGKNEAKDTISLCLCLSSHPQEEQIVYATFSAHILSDNGGKTTSKSTNVHAYLGGPYYTSPVGYGWKDFWTKDKNFRTNLLCNNTLRICVEVVFSTERSVLIDSCNKMSLRTNTYDCDLSKNFASLLQTKEFSDIVLSTRGNDFPAHKAILTARSEVFAAILKHDTKKKQLNRIKIEDFSDEVVGEMLRYIYTGNCEKLDELPVELLAAADKYDLNGLKIISGRALFQTISAENALWVLIVADKLNAKELKNDVLEFIVSNCSEILSAAGWRNMLPRSELVNDVCQALVRQLTYDRVELLQF